MLSKCPRFIFNSPKFAAAFKSMIHVACRGGIRGPNSALACNKISEVTSANLDPLGHETVENSNYP